MKFIPHEYQKYAIDRVVADPALGLFLEMGLGKTVITLTAINELRFHRWAVARCLVVAPKKVAEATWNAEAAQWGHLKHLRIIPVLGSAQKRIQALNAPGDIWVINRENVPWLVDYYRNGWPFDMVVLDESSSFKNAQSKRFKALKLVRPRIPRLVELTGTPSPTGWRICGPRCTCWTAAPGWQDHFQLPGGVFHRGPGLSRPAVSYLQPTRRGRPPYPGGHLRHLRGA